MPTDLFIEYARKQEVYAVGDAFWNSIPKFFPQIHTGDYPPDLTLSFDTMTRKFIDCEYDNIEKMSPGKAFDGVRLPVDIIKQAVAYAWPLYLAEAKGANPDDHIEPNKKQAARVQENLEYFLSHWVHMNGGAHAETQDQ